MKRNDDAWHYANQLGIEKVPEGYWISRGHSQFYAQTIMGELQDDLVNDMYSAHYDGVHSVEISHNFADDQGMLGATTNGRNAHLMIMIEHDDILLPLWRACTNEWLGAEFGHVDISNVQLTESVLGMLGHALEGKTIETLSLMNVGLGGSGFVTVAKLVQGSPSMVKLHLEGNHINDVNAATFLFSAVRQRPTLVEVWLEGCSLGNNIDVLKTVIRGIEHVKRVDISSNSIGPEGARVVANVLKLNGLQHINLSNNDLKDAGITHLAGMLKNNTSLTSMDLNNTGISEGSAGFNALNNAIFDTTNLNTVFGSNHTCRLMLGYSNSLGYPIELPIQRYAQFYRPNVINVIQRKIAYALGLNSKFGTLRASLLDDFPMQLIPELMVFVQDVYVQDVRYSRASHECKNNDATMTNLFKVTRDCIATLLFVPQAKASSKS